VNPPAVELVEEVDVRLLASLSDNFRSPYEAIFELIDNGLASRVDERSVTVTVTGGGTPGASLKIITKGGRGMGANGLGDFFRWGRKPDEVGLNRYGQGGKAALGYLGTGFVIRSNAQGEDFAYELKDDDWLSRPDGQEKRFRASPGPAPFPKIGFVEIEIHRLRRAINFKKLDRELAWRYRPALEAGRLDLRIGSRSRAHRVSAAPLDAETRNEINETLIVPSLTDPDVKMPVQLTGWVGIAPPRYEERGGIRCSAYGRVVATNEYFGHRTASFKASLNSLLGEVDLSFVPVVLNKTGFDQASPAWEAAREVMYREMEPLVDRLLARKDPIEPSDQERERAMEARDKAHKALDKIAAESARQGAGGRLTGRKPPKPRDTVRPEPGPPSREVQPPQAQTPPPPGAVGRLRRKGMSLDWDVRVLDPKTRSTTDHVNGRVEIIINKVFPLYVERNGDMAYMLETGLLEELKPGSEDDKTVAEYHREVTEALHEALGSPADRRSR
jgi:hypothetical protein